MKSRRLNKACAEQQKKGCSINNPYYGFKEMKPCERPCEQVLESFLNGLVS